MTKEHYKSASTKYYNLNRGGVFLLALGAIEDLDVELGSPMVIIKHQDPILMEIMILKTVQDTSEESIIVAIIIHLQLIRRPAAGCFSEYSLPKLMTIHELCELQRKMLLFTIVCTSEGQERK
jgi:hypothetical protein